jgi:hypothetical protein
LIYYSSDTPTPAHPPPRGRVRKGRTSNFA